MRKEKEINKQEKERKTNKKTRKKNILSLSFSSFFFLRPHMNMNIPHSASMCMNHQCAINVCPGTTSAALFCDRSENRSVATAAVNFHQL